MIDLLDLRRYLTNIRSRGVGEGLDGRALEKRHGICRPPLVQLRDVTDPPLILDIKIYGKLEKAHGSHFRIEEKSTPLNVVETLETEFETQQGRIMVSRKSRCQL